MATKPTINNLASSSRFTTSGLNSRFTALKDAFANVLGTNGASGSDNTMSGNLNMGSNRITNVAAPISSADAARKADITTLQTQIDNINTTGLVATGDTIKISANDTTSNYIEDKLVAGTNITLTVVDEGGNETLEVSSSETNKVFADSTDAASGTAGYLLDKLEAGDGITVEAGTGNAAVKITSTAANAVGDVTQAYLEEASALTTDMTTLLQLDIGAVVADDIYLITAGSLFVNSGAAAAELWTEFAIAGEATAGAAMTGTANAVIYGGTDALANGNKRWTFSQSTLAVVTTPGNLVVEINAVAFGSATVYPKFNSLRAIKLKSGA